MLPAVVVILVIIIWMRLIVLLLHFHLNDIFGDYALVVAVARIVAIAAGRAAATSTSTATAATIAMLLAGIAQCLRILCIIVQLQLQATTRLQLIDMLAIGVQATLKLLDLMRL